MLQIWTEVKLILTPPRKGWSSHHSTHVSWGPTLKNEPTIYTLNQWLKPSPSSVIKCQLCKLQKALLVARSTSKGSSAASDKNPKIEWSVDLPKSSCIAMTFCSSHSSKCIEFNTDVEARTCWKNAVTKRTLPAHGRLFCTVAAKRGHAIQTNFLSL